MSRFPLRRFTIPAVLCRYCLRSTCRRGYEAIPLAHIPSHNPGGATDYQDYYFGDGDRDSCTPGVDRTCRLITSPARTESGESAGELTCGSAFTGDTTGVDGHWYNVAHLES